MQSVQLLAQSKERGPNSIQRRSRGVGFHTTGPLHLSVTRRRADTKFEKFKKKKKIELETNKPNSVLKITVGEPTDEKEISVSRSLNQLIGSGPTLYSDTYVKKLNSPSAYFIHCDLIDRDFNFVNNKKSDLLAKIDIKGRPYEKITYEASSSQPIRDCSTDKHVNSITISVKDGNGELFDFKGLPLEFELELN